MDSRPPSKITRIQRGFKTLVRAFVLILTAYCVTDYCVSDTAFAKRAEISEATPLSVFAAGGFTTQKSGVAESNDTSTSTIYGFAVTGGEENNLSMEMLTDTSSVAFALNKRSVTTSWQEMTARYRMGWCYTGIIIANVGIVGESDGDTEGKLINVYGKGYGANLGLSLPAGKSAAVQLDIRSVSISDAKELNQKKVTLAPRTDVDIRGVVALWRPYLDGLFGFRYRTYAATLDGTAYQELVATTYFGFSFNLDL